MRTLVIIRGLPGSGKTSLASLFAALPRSVAVAQDDYPGRYDLNGYHPELNGEVARWCFDKVREYMELGMSVIAVHNTFVTKDSIGPYCALAKEYGYRCQVVECQGDYGSEHNVPQSVINDMRARWEPWGRKELRDEACVRG